ncbi:FMN-binding protein [candidate division WOR-3 bacterium]|nr:FMN-binding protein [candidate division WOR-3 bacterium]
MTGTRFMVITLFCVALVCSVILSFVYSYTAPRIEETRGQLMLSGLQEVIKAAEFKEVIPETLWQALDTSGKAVGVVFRVFPQGYGGLIPITVGLDLEGAVTGIRIASAAEGLNETPGLGAKILEDDFRGQFIGKTGKGVLLTKDGGEIDAITAATISSRAVCNGIGQGIDRFREYLCESFDPACVFPDASGFIKIIKDTLWLAVAGNDTIGFVVCGSTRGYADRIDYAFGVTIKSRIKDIKVVFANETPGIGDVIQSEAFLGKFKTKIPDAVSGATISSQALIKAVKDDIARFKEYLP